MASSEEKKSGEETENREEETSDAGEEGALASTTLWFSGWYDTAKKKLAETNEFMKHDIQEFTQAVQTDASRLVAATATTMKDKLHINVDMEEASTTTRTFTNSLSNFLGNIASKVGPIRPDDDENLAESAIMGTSSGTKVLSPSEARIHAIRTDPATFCNEPDNEEEFYMWLPSLNVEDKKEEISSLMLDCSQVRSLYSKLVPSAVSHSDFWARYFFKLHQHEKAEQRRALLVERAHKTHNDIEWDDEDDWVQAKPLDATGEGKDEQTSTPGNAQTQLKPEEDERQKLAAVPVPSTKDEVAASEDSGVKAGENVALATEISQTENLGQPKDSAEVVSKPVPAAAAASTDSEQTTETEVEKHAEPQTEEKAKSEDAKTNASTIKVPSSGESSDDWEKDFDLDMTEDEIKEALMESNAADVNVDDIGDDWEDWE